jgi:DNA-directed RNA polymerase subunit omega
MNPTLVVEASKIIPEPHLLINLVSRRVRQLNSGNRPMVALEGRTGLSDIALMEIAQGKLSIRPAESIAAEAS